ncbi:MAG: response regulator [Sphingomonadales bacterium]|nr:MAG: response regulator [Sphingomonadales bacterium]TNF01586.1 MAG: response regulator [Sphingomonadales bacterium]
MQRFHFSGLSGLGGGLSGFDLSGENRVTAGDEGQRLSLLVVDEDAGAREAMARRFSHMKYDVRLAEDGMVALALLPAHRFDAILVDIGLEVISGVETIRKMRISGLLGGAAIFSIARRNDSHNAKRSLEGGADDVIAKPFDFDIVDLRIRHMVRRMRDLEDMARHNETLDARIARRAMELGEARAELDELRGDRGRLISSIQALHDEIERLTERQCSD